MSESNRFVWLDLEMTGLNPDTDCIIEIATIITDSDLNIIAEGPELVINQKKELLAQMDKWNQTQHARSGLLERVQRSTLNETEAEQQTLDFIKKHVAPQTAPLCGNSICQDRRFLYKYMPSLSNYLHYRNVDVSSIKILASYWQPSVLQQVKKSENHRAKDDILESIQELVLYRSELFKV